MSWFTLLKNDQMKERIDNIKGLIQDFDRDVIDTDERLQQRLDEIYSQVEDLDNKRATEEAKDLNNQDIGRFFLDESFADLIDYMDAAYDLQLLDNFEESMEDEVSEPLLADMPDERIEEILNDTEALLPEIEKKGGEFTRRMIEEYISEARRFPRRATALTRLILRILKDNDLKVD